jgi:hypothetical protein
MKRWRAIAGLVIAAPVACGSFGAATDTAVGGADASTDASIESSADGAARFCANHTDAILCADFEDEQLDTGWTPIAASAETILSRTGGPDRKLLVTLPVGPDHVSGGALVFHLDVPPSKLKMGFVLSDVAMMGQYAEVFEVETVPPGAAVGIAVNGSAMQAWLAVTGVQQQTMDLGAIPSEPTRFTITEGSDGIVVQRADSTPQKFQAVPPSTQRALDISAGGYYAEAPKGGSFRIDDVLIEAQ